MNVDVRPVAEHEIEEFLDWFERYWAELETFNDYPDEFSRAEYRRAVREAGERRFWWLDHAGRHAGFCVFIIGPHWYRRDVFDGYIDEFYVEPSHRRSGLGKSLANALLEEFRRAGVREIRLSVLRRNERAAAFWSGLGFGVEMTRMALRLDGSAHAGTTEEVSSALRPE
jgi:ribosomal protein S18 acetylase RimI-like enzyme